MVAKNGRGALMAKFDVKAAYLNIPVHPKDRFLLALKWRGQFSVDLTLHVGLRSAPFIFNSVASLVKRIISHNYNVPDLEHYLYDFILAGPPASPIFAQYLSTALEVCKHWGLLLHPKKCEGPSTSLVIVDLLSPGGYWHSWTLSRKQLDSHLTSWILYGS